MAAGSVGLRAGQANHWFRRYTGGMETAAPRRPFQFGLKTLFVVVALLGVVRAVVGRSLRLRAEHEDEERVARELSDSIAQFGRDGQFQPAVAADDVKDDTAAGGQGGKHAVQVVGPGDETAGGGDDQVARLQAG